MNVKQIYEQEQGILKISVTLAAASLRFIAACSVAVRPSVHHHPFSTLDSRFAAALTLPLPIPPFLKLPERAQFLFAVKSSTERLNRSLMVCQDKFEAAKLQEDRSSAMKNLESCDDQSLE